MRFRKVSVLTIGVISVILITGLVNSVLEGSTTLTTEEFISDSIKSIEIFDQNSQIEIKPSTTDKIVLQFPQTKNKAYSVNLDQNQNLVLKRKPAGIFGLFTINFSVKKVTVYLPEKEFELLAETTNGTVKAEDVNLKNATLKTTNGAVSMKNIQAEDLILKTTNGKVSTNDVISNRLNAKSTNGSINLQTTEIVAELIANTTNGSINVGLIGSANQYRIDCQVTNGKCNVPASSGNKLVNLTTTNGSINVEFDK